MADELNIVHADEVARFSLLWEKMKEHALKSWKQVSVRDIEAVDGHYDRMVTVLIQNYQYTEQYARKEVWKRLNEIG